MRSFLDARLLSTMVLALAEVMEGCGFVFRYGCVLDGAPGIHLSCFMGIIMIGKALCCGVGSLQA